MGQRAKTRFREAKDAPRDPSSSKDVVTQNGRNLAAEDVTLHLEVADFAASLGLASASNVSGSGFDDRDFRKPNAQIAANQGIRGPATLQENGSDVHESKEWFTEGAKEGGKRQGRLGVKDGLTFPSEGERGRGPKPGTASKGNGAALAGDDARFQPGGLVVHRGGKHVDATDLVQSKPAIVDKNLLAAVTIRDDDEVGPWYKHAESLASRLLPRPLANTGITQGAARKRKRHKSEGSVAHPMAPTGQAGWEHVMERARREGEKLLAAAAVAFERNQRGGGRDAQWLATARRSGTASDKVAAMTILVQEDPVANLRSLDALLAMASTRAGKRQAAVALDSLRELFLAALLPDRNLTPLTERSQLAAVLDTTPEGGADGASRAGEGRGLQVVTDRRRLLLLWYWEECLKERYAAFVSFLEAASRDPLPFLKEKATKALFELLCGKPEQDRRLLMALINKLGDPDRKVASKAGYLLGLLVERHPARQLLVVQEVDAFVFRPNVGLRARYYASLFLNQLMLSKRGDGPAVARALVNIYFALFKVVTASQADEPAEQSDHAKGEQQRGSHPKRGHGKGQEGGGKRKPSGQRGRSHGGGKEEAVVEEAVELNSRIFSALLTGVNRAFPFVAVEEVEEVVEQHTGELFKMAHSSSFNVALQALLLLYHIMASHHAVSERFYRALYSVLLSPQMATSSKAAMFLSLLLKAMKEDLDARRVAAFVKRLLQGASQQTAPFACGVLLLVSEVLKGRPALWRAVMQPEDWQEDVERFQDVEETEEVPVGSVAAADMEEGEGSVRRRGEEPNGMGVGEGESTKRGRNGTGRGAGRKDQEDGTDELVGPRIDVGDEEEEGSEEGSGGGVWASAKVGRQKRRRKSIALNDGDVDEGSEHSERARRVGVEAGRLCGETGRSTEGKGGRVQEEVGLAEDAGESAGVQGEDVDGEGKWPLAGYYDPRKREPAFSGAEAACWWELLPLAAHVHPSVGVMAKTLLAGAAVVYTGDPLRDLAMGVFLDRFVERKPKAMREGVAGGRWERTALLQPGRKGEGGRQLLVGADAFLGLEESEVAVEDVFFHRFYSSKPSKVADLATSGMKAEHEDELDGGVVDEEGGKRRKKKKLSKRERERERRRKLEGDTSVVLVKGAAGMGGPRDGSAVGDSDEEEILEVESDDEELQRLLGAGDGEGAGYDGASDESQGKSEDVFEDWDYDQLCKVWKDDDGKDVGGDAGGMDEEAGDGNGIVSDEDSVEMAWDGDEEASSASDEESDDGGEDSRGIVDGVVGDSDGSEGVDADMEGGAKVQGSSEREGRERLKGKKGSRQGNKAAREGEVGGGRARKKRKMGASPFAPAEEFAHLINGGREGGDGGGEGGRKFPVGARQEKSKRRRG